MQTQVLPQATETRKKSEIRKFKMADGRGIKSITSMIFRKISAVIFYFWKNTKFYLLFSYDTIILISVYFQFLKH